MSTFDDEATASFWAGMGISPYPEYPIAYPVGSSSGIVTEINPAPAGEYVVAQELGGEDEYRTLLGVADELTGALSHVTHRAIMRDPTAKPAFETLKYGVLAGGLKITPAVKEKPDASTTEADPDAELAQEIAEFCQRSTDRLDEHILLFLGEIMDAMVYRHKVAERVQELAMDGPDVGKLVLARLPRKPRWSYQFRVDNKNRLHYLRCLVDLPEQDGKPRVGWADIPAWKFVVASWAVEDGDPRGSSVLDAVHEPWVLKRRLIPNWYKGLKQFGSPSLFGTTHDGAEDIPARDSSGNLKVDETGKPLPPTSPQVAMKVGLERFFKSGSVIVGPFGSNVKVVESVRDGAANEKALERCDRDITRAILLQVRATTESRFGSKADSQTGQDILGVFVRFVRLWLCALLDASVYHPLVEVNWGKEVADRLTPNISLGEVEHQDFAKAAAAVATLFQSSYFTEGQLSETDARLGLPVRDPGDPRVGPQANADPNADPQAPDSTPPDDGAAE